MYRGKLIEKFKSIYRKLFGYKIRCFLGYTIYIIRSSINYFIEYTIFKFRSFIVFIIYKIRPFLGYFSKKFIYFIYQTFNPEKKY